MTDFDFGPHRKAMADRQGMCDTIDASWGHLSVILAAMARDPNKAFALTDGAEPAAHGLMLDTPTVLSYSRSVMPGVILSHDPFAWGTDEYSVALANTAAAFIAEGLPAPSLEAQGAYRAAMCFLSFAQV